MSLTLAKLVLLIFSMPEKKGLWIHIEVLELSKQKESAKEASFQQQNVISSAFHEKY